MNAVWSHLVGWILQGVQLMIGAATAIFRAVCRLGGFFVAGQVAVLVTAARWLLAQVRAVADVLIRMASGAAFPVMAWQCAGMWSSVPVSLLRERQRIDPSTSSVRDRWQGVAAERYYDAAVEQARAVENVLSGAELVRDQLRDSAIATGALYAALCVGTFEFVGVLCAAAVLTATGVGAPEGVIGAIAVLADFVALVGSIAGAIVAYGFVTARIPDALCTLFPGGWPSPHPSTFADGSLSDGDTTDWRLWM